MSSPYIRLRTEDEELMYDAGLMDGRDKERERIITAFVERYPNHFVEVIDRGMGETYKSHDNCPQCVAIALIKGENK